MSPTRPDFHYFSFLGGFGQEGQRCCFLSVPSAPSFHGPLTEEEMREDPGPAEQVGLGYRAVSAVGVTEDVLVRFIEGYDQLVDCWELSLFYIRNMPF